MVEKCNKCKLSSRVPGDSWCVGCSAWESIGRILTSKWEGPSGLKGIADQLVVDCARQVHALRSFGAGHRPAPGTSPAGATSVKEEQRDKSEAARRDTPGLAAKSKAVPQGDLEEYSYTEGEESEESERPPPQDCRPSLPRHRSAPVEAGKTRHQGEVRVKESKGDRDPRGDRDRREDKELPKEPKRKRDRSKEKKKDKKEEKSGRKQRRRRGGRKHQRLGRLLEDPYKTHHRKLSESFLRERPDWADFEGRARGSH